MLGGGLESRRIEAMQGVIKSYDPGTAEGVIVCDIDRAEYALAANALENSIFRTLRQGQRVVFELDGSDRAINLRTGAEPDLGMGSVQLQ
jgi:CspA family cold shock protein